jgi:acetyl esterase
VALDEATVRLLEQMAAAGAPPLHQMTPREARAMMASRLDQAPPGPQLAAVRDTRVPVSGGYVPVRVLTPDVGPRGVIVYYHGGGWVLGGLDGFDGLGRQLALRTGSVVIMVDYRLAPEYRFPTAVDDSWAALRWAAAHLTELADGPVPLIVAGDSAGGNLAAIMTQRAKAAGGPSIAVQVLAYPVTDCDLDTTSYTDPVNQLMLSRDSMVWFWDHYAPDPAARVHPDASPLRSTDLLRLPPAVILTAEHDVLRDEGELYATQLVKAGVPVLQQRFAGQMHGFFTMTGLLPGADAAMDFVVAGIEKHLAGEATTGRRRSPALSGDRRDGAVGAEAEQDRRADPPHPGHRDHGQALGACGDRQASHRPQPQGRAEEHRHRVGVPGSQVRGGDLGDVSPLGQEHHREPRAGDPQERRRPVALPGRVRALAVIRPETGDQQVGRPGHEQRRDDRLHEAMRHQGHQHLPGRHGDGHMHRERGRRADPHGKGPVPGAQHHGGKQRLVRKLG